jgi:hypothetical protein
VVVKKDAEAHTTSYTYTVTGSAGAAVNVLLAGKGGDLSTTGSVTLTRDAQGALVGVTLVSTRAAGGDASVGGSGEKTSGSTPTKGTTPDKGTNQSGPEKSAGGSVGAGTGTERAVTTTVNLDLTNSADRGVVQDWLNQNNEQLGTPLALTAGSMVPDRRVAGDPFQNLLFEKAKVSQVAYDEVKNVFDFGLEVKAGLELGLAVHTENSTKTAQDPLYLSAPRPGDTRTFVKDPTC